MKSLIATLKALRETAPSEPARIAALRKSKPPLVGYYGVKRPPQNGSPEACGFHMTRRAEIAHILTREGFEKITVRDGNFSMTVWNTKENLTLIIRNAGSR